MNTFPPISTNAKMPKYQQLVNNLLTDIETGVLKIGDRLPSINEASEDCYLSRDTVERAYTELHRIGVITSIFRKGYFITGINAKIKTKIFFLVGRMNESNKMLFNAFVDAVGKNVIVDVFTYNYKNDNFREIINNHLGNYHYYVIMPHLIEENAENIKTLKKISSERLVLLDNPFENFTGNYSSLWSKVGQDIFGLLKHSVTEMKHYDTLNLVLPNEDYFDSELLNGMREFCEEYGFEFQVLDGLKEEKMEVRNAYFVMDDTDLVEAIKQSQQNNWTLGQEIGVVSFGDACFKEVLAGGITVISAQPERFGALAAEIVTGNKKHQKHVPLSMVWRKSL